MDVIIYLESDTPIDHIHIVNYKIKSNSIKQYFYEQGQYIKYYSNCLNEIHKKELRTGAPILKENSPYKEYSNTDVQFLYLGFCSGIFHILPNFDIENTYTYIKKYYAYIPTYIVIKIQKLFRAKQILKRKKHLQEIVNVANHILYKPYGIYYKELLEKNKGFFLDLI
jgi:hypothetical protein